MRALSVRHGQSERDAVHRLQGQADAALLDIGREQARGLRDDITRPSPDRRLTSGLQRVTETAALIGAGDAERLETPREFDRGER